MNIYLRIWWLSLVFLLLSEISVASFFHLKLGTGIVVIFTVAFLPLINILVQEVKKDSQNLNLRFNRTALTKWLILGLYGVIAHIYSFHTINSIVGFYFLFSVVFVFESRVSFLIALVFLTFCPVLLITENPGIAETFAVLAYYFLCIGVVTQVLESILNKNEPHVW